MTGDNLAAKGEIVDERPPRCSFCRGTGSVDGQWCGDCCGFGVDCIDWAQEIAYRRAGINAVITVVEQAEAGRLCDQGA